MANSKFQPARRAFRQGLEGHGWDVDRWGRWPTATLLDDAAPGRPAAIWAHDHHSLWTSRAALARSDPFPSLRAP